METATSFLTSPSFVSLIIAFLVVETAVLCLFNRRSGLRRWYAPIASNGAGIFLLMALVGALGGNAGQILMLGSLSGALVCHIVDVALRQERDFLSPGRV